MNRDLASGNLVRVNQGKFFQSSSLNQSLAAGQYLRVTLENPAGSGKTMYIVRYLVGSSSGSSIIHERLNPTTNLPETAISPANMKLSSDAPVSSILHKADVGASGLAGGTDLNIEYVTSELKMSPIEFFPVVRILPPSNILGLTLDSDTVSREVMLNVMWFEE